eukprot:453876-Alexandrium_andersonii.AAC.1
MHALTSADLEHMFFLSRPKWPSSLSLARAILGARASHTASKAGWAPGAGSPKASRAAGLLTSPAVRRWRLCLLYMIRS